MGLMSFEMTAISAGVLRELQGTDDAGRSTVPYTDQQGGLPLRCCLKRSRQGELIALVSYAPLRRWSADRDVDPGAYVELGPIFIHGSSCAGPDGDNELTGARRVFRAYDPQGRIHGGTLAEPGEEDTAVKDLFDDSQVAVIHVRTVEYGCFVAEIHRPDIQNLVLGTQ